MRPGWRERAASSNGFLTSANISIFQRMDDPQRPLWRLCSMLEGAQNEYFRILLFGGQTFFLPYFWRSKIGW